jgi:hypothetical protein
MTIAVTGGASDMANWKRRARRFRESWYYYIELLKASEAERKALLAWQRAVREAWANRPYITPTDPVGWKAFECLLAAIESEPGKEETC